MAQSNETEDAVEKKHAELCAELNVDSEATTQSWKSYKEISENCTLDGEPLHWIACSLYVACRKALTPTVGRSGVAVEGNCVSLTKLLRLCNINLCQFFTSIKKWMTMGSVSADFRERIEKLQRNFAVSSLLFEKFKPIFLDLFVNLEVGETSKPPTKGNKKTKILPCTVNAVFEFCWCLFVCVKGEFPTLSDDLVNMYHLLLSCTDLIFGNAFMAQRRDLINPAFKGLPLNWSSPSFELPSEPPCIIAILCEAHKGLLLEAKSIKESTWKPVITNFFDKGILKGDDKTLTGILDLATFEFNLKSLNKVYETFVLSVGEFDERIFLGEKGSMTKVAVDSFSDAAASFSSPNMRSLIPDTPLTGRRYLKNKTELLTPVSTATQSVAKLHAYLFGCSNAPSSSLATLLKDCNETVLESIETRCKLMGALFLEAYAPLSSEEMAGKRLNLAEALYYRLLEQIIRDEQRKKPNIDLQCLVNQEVFHQALFTCCVEMVIYAYSVHGARFPWVLECFRLDAVNFCKVIENVVLIVKDKLSRDLIKHLNAIEEQVLETLAWVSSSPIWDTIKSLSGPIPQWKDVSIQENSSNVATTNNQIPTILPPLRRLPNATPGVPHSPLSSAPERFYSPSAEMAKKQLFKDSNIKPGQSLLNQSVNNSPGNSAQPAPPSNGKQLFKEGQTPPKKVKAGSLGLFLRKFYSLASVRLQELCKNLRLDDHELKQKIWTCLEHSVISQTHLMRDRHLDQILMCAVYVVCKVSNTEECNVERTFTEIMRCYRLQPQATGSVYRSVLFTPNLVASGNSQNEGGEVPSPTPSPSPPSPGQAPGGRPVRQERGDLISFYNTDYVRSMQQFVRRFTRAQTDVYNRCALSPLPGRRLAGPGGPRRVSDQHLLYVRPLTDSSGVTAFPFSGNLTYRISRSPAKDLHSINSLMACESVTVTKRPSTEAMPEYPKKAATPVMARKLQSLIIERPSNRS